MDRVTLSYTDNWHNISGLQGTENTLMFCIYMRMSSSEIFFIFEVKSLFVSVLRSQSAFDDIGTIEYDRVMTVIVLQIEDINDNRPEFDKTSLTVGYPNAEIAHQLLPPYLMKVQVMRARAGLPSGEQVKELGLFNSSKWFIWGHSKVNKWNATLMDKLGHWQNNHIRLKHCVFGPWHGMFLPASYLEELREVSLHQHLTKYN